MTLSWVEAWSSSSWSVLMPEAASAVLDDRGQQTSNFQHQLRVWGWDGCPSCILVYIKRGTRAPDFHFLIYSMSTVYHSTGITKSCILVYPKWTVPHYHHTGIVCHIASQNQDSLHTSMLVERRFCCCCFLSFFFFLLFTIITCTIN